MDRSRALRGLTRGVYLFFILGLLLHTSPEPVVLGKYSPFLAAVLAILVLLFVPVSRFVAFLSKKSTLKPRGGKPIVLTPLKKTTALLLVLAAILTVFEVQLRALPRSRFDGRVEKRIHPFLQVDYSKRFVAPIAVKKPPSTFRIFLLGGSSVFAARVPTEKSHARLLEQLLRTRYPDRKIEVVNAGGPWHASEHSVIKYLFKIKDYDPDLIVVWHAINDLYRSFSPESLTQGVFRADYSHFLGPLARIFSDFSDRRPLRVRLLSVNLY